jgi:hypothetical protein
MKFLSYQHVFRGHNVHPSGTIIGDADEGTIFWRATKPTQTGTESQTIELLALHLLYCSVDYRSHILLTPCITP